MNDKSMSLVDHLEELRLRLFWSVAATLVLTLAAFLFSGPLLKILLLPAGGIKLKAFGPMDGFMIRWRVGLYAGIFFSIPIWAYQLYGFVKPGLDNNERRVIIRLFGGSLVLFLLGTVFGYFLLHQMIRVLIQLFPPEVEYLPSANSYISFVVFFLLACGVAFQLPTLSSILVSLRILNSTILRRQRKIAYFVLFVFAEIITPVSDPIFAPMIVMVPLVFWYEISIWIARRIETGPEQSQH